MNKKPERKLEHIPLPDYLTDRDEWYLKIPKDKKQPITIWCDTNLWKAFYGSLKKED